MFSFITPPSGGDSLSLSRHLRGLRVKLFQIHSPLSRPIPPFLKKIFKIFIGARDLLEIIGKKL
jgi:hypothetical protein